MATDRFSRHLITTAKGARRPRLIPDANFSRNVSFHVLRDNQGNDLWIGRYLADLLEVIAECHPQGCLVEVDGQDYHVIVAPARKEPAHG